MANKESSLIKLKRQIKDNNISNLYLLFGQEEYIKDVYLKKLKSLVSDDGFAEFNHIIIESNDHSFAEIDGILESFPVMAEKKLVVFKNSGIFKTPKEDTKEFWSSRLSDIPDYLLLIFDEKEVDKRSVTYKALAKHGFPVEFEYLKEAELTNWVEGEFLKQGKKIDKSNAEYLVSLCDDGVSAMKNEIDKLVSYCPEQIHKTDIDKLVSKSLQVKIFDMTDGIMTKNAEKVMNILTELKTIKEPAFKVLYALSSTFDKLLYSKLMIAEGASYSDVASKIGLAPFIAKKYVQNANGFKEDFLIDRITKIADIDFGIKQGELNDWIALESYITECLYKK